MILAHYSPKELNDFIDKIGLPTEEEWPEVKTKSLLRIGKATIKKMKKENRSICLIGSIIYRRQNYRFAENVL